MTIPPKAVEAACKGYGAHQPYLPANMQRALTAAEPFIRTAVIEECATVIERFGVDIQMQGTMGRLAEIVRALAGTKTKETT